MRLFPCRACVAKDQEIARLYVLLERTGGRLDAQAGEILKLARDATGLTPAPDPGPPPEPLPPIVEEFLAVRFEPGTAEWRRQTREARKLVALGKEPLQVNELLNRGQAVIW